jgi:hypothetical protein
MWQDDQSQPDAINNIQRIRAGQPDNANNVHQSQLSVTTFPWYY